MAQLTDLPGFLLTRQWRDRAGSIELEFWAVSEHGPLRLVVPDQQAVCFIRRQDSSDDDPIPCQRRHLDLQSLPGEPVDGLYFNQQRLLMQFKERARGRGIELLESDIKPADRYLMERFIAAPMAISGEGRQMDGYIEIIAPQLKTGSYLPDLSYLSLDIETDGMEGAILSIAFCGRGHEEILIQGVSEEWPSDLPITWFESEATLLQGLLRRIQQLDPDLLLGWNLINFDLNVLEQRCHHHRIPFTLGRGKAVARVLQPQQPGQIRIASIPGRVALDGIDNLRGAFWSFESFALNHVAGELLGRKKLIEGSSDDKIAEIRRLFRQDRPALAAYNLEDCRLVEAIFDKTDLLNFILQRSVMTGLPLGRQGGSVAAFDNLYLPRLHRAGAVAHDIGAIKHNISSPGGHVMESQPGLYDNVLVLDFKSLYPSIIRTFKIDPLGMMRPGEEPVPGFLDAHFSRHDGILPGIITDLWEARDKAKREQNQPLSQAVKIIMNSFYGVLGSSGCRFYDPRLASSITRRGHQIITRSRDWLEQQGFRVIYGDTDSLFVLLGSGYSEAQSLTTGGQLAAGLNGWWQQILQDEFNLPCQLEIEFETHFIRFLMPTIRGSETGSKKRYAGTVRDSDGTFQVRFKGLESVRSDWTPLAQQFQRELYHRIFFDQPYETYIADTAVQLRAGKLDHQLVYRKRLRRRLDEYIRNVPPHVQAARKLARPGRTISYLITLNGPEPAGQTTSTLDYQHYIDRQLAPVADGILHFLNDSFERITADQMALF